MKENKKLYKVLKGICKILMKILYMPKVEGTENIPNGQVIFCGNHRSFIDAPIIKVTCKKDVRFLAKESLRKNKFLAFLGWVFEVVYVKRDSKDVSALKSTLSLLKKGDSIARTLKNLSRDPERLAQMVEKTKVLAKPNSAKKICKILMDEIL